jgi:hypothetical protein
MGSHGLHVPAGPVSDRKELPGCVKLHRGDNTWMIAAQCEVRIMSSQGWMCMSVLHGRQKGSNGFMPAQSATGVCACEFLQLCPLAPYVQMHGQAVGMVKDQCTSAKNVHTICLAPRPVAHGLHQAPIAGHGFCNDF